MPITLESIENMQNYLHQLLPRADHHAKEVEAVCLSLIGAVIWKSDEIQVRTYKDKMTNQLWMRVSHDWYSFTYNHGAGTVEMKADTHHGRTLHVFSNSTSASEILTVFQSL